MSFITRILGRLGRFTLAAAGAALLAGTGSMAQAATMTFSFSGLTDGSSNAQVQSYVQSVVGGAGTVTVTGAVGAKTYNGDGHVVGPGTGSTSYTLSNWNSQTNSLYGTAQSFLMNNQGTSNNSNDPLSNNIVMKFSGGMTITGISFNFEIFPDAANPPGNPPDFIFGTNTNSNVFTQLGVTPGTSGTYSANWKHSPVSGSVSNEQYQQYLGFYSNSNLGAGVTTLYFNDWPAEIGINNITLTTAVATPEPASCSLILAGLGSVAIYSRIKRRKAKV